MTDYPSAQATPFQYTCSHCKAQWTKAHLGQCPKSTHPAAHCARHGTWIPQADLTRFGDRCPGCEQRQREELPDTKLRALKPPADSDVVGMLEDLLTRAKAGEIRACAIACVRHGKETSTQFVSDHADSTMRLLGVLAHLQHRLNRQLDRAEYGE